MTLRISRTFHTLVWDSSVRQRAIDFWFRRRVVFNETSERFLAGKRGGLLGNLTSFDMSKLISKITISISPENEVECLLQVTTLFQIITDYNKAWLDLEMETFETFLLRNDEQEERWKIFRGNYKKAAWAWSLSAGRRGNKISIEERP